MKLSQFDFRKEIKSLSSERGVLMGDLAQEIGISLPYLSLIINGKRTLNEEQARKITRFFDIPDPKKSYFIQSVRYNNCKDPTIKKEIEDEWSTGDSENDINLDANRFKVISKWYYPAIFELIELYDGEITIDMMARRLGISKLEAGLAVERLNNLSLITCKDGKIEKTGKLIFVGDIPSKFIRDYHHEVLKRAQISLQQSSSSKRDITAATVAFDMKDLPEINKRIARFRKEMLSFCARGKANSVYQLAIQFFRLDKD